MSIGSLWKEFDTWWDGTAIGEEINAAAASALAELEAVAPDVLKVVTSSTATAILTGLAASNPTSAIIAAGIEAAEASFKAQSITVASETISTFAASIHNSVTTQQSAGAVTPAA